MYTVYTYILKRFEFLVTGFVHPSMFWEMRMEPGSCIICPRMSWIEWTRDECPQSPTEVERPEVPFRSNPFYSIVDDPPFKSWKVGALLFHPYPSGIGMGTSAVPRHRYKMNPFIHISYLCSFCHMSHLDGSAMASLGVEIWNYN